jgi:hypothetical protein
MDKTISQHINHNLSELDNPSTNAQRRRHLEGEVEALKKYQENHPDSEHDPTNLELYCDQYPNALECRIYEE